MLMQPLLLQQCVCDAVSYLIMKFSSPVQASLQACLTVCEALDGAGVDFAAANECNRQLHSHFALDIFHV
jgi:hypothetical protein